MFYQVKLVNQFGRAVADYEIFHRNDGESDAAIESELRRIVKVNFLEEFGKNSNGYYVSIHRSPEPVILS